MREANHVLQKYLRVFPWVEHLKGEKADPNNVIAEDESSQDVGILAIFLGGFLIA